MFPDFEELTAMSRRRARPRSRLPWTERRSLRIAVPLTAVVLVATFVVSGTVRSPHTSAGAVPVCDETTTAPCPPQTTAPPPPPWVVNVIQLNQDPAAPPGGATAERFWLPLLINSPGVAKAAAAPKASATGVGTPFDPIPAGTSRLNFRGQFVFPDDPQPANSTMAIRVSEDGAPGVLCRTTPLTVQPRSGGKLRMLVPGPISETAADLAPLSFLLRPTVTGLPANFTFTITSATVAPQPDGILFDLHATLKVKPNATTPEWVFDLDYRRVVTLSPSTGFDVTRVLGVRASGPSTIGLTFASPPPANANDVIGFVGAVMQPKIDPAFAATLQRTGDAVNTVLLASHNVRWFTEQGFTISIRKVTYTTTEAQVFPSLCLLGPP